MSSQLWLRMAGYINYISSRYIFISSFVSLTKYAGRKLENLMWLRMAGYLNCISCRYVFISYFVSLTKYAGQKLNNLMWICMVGEFMSIYFFRVRFEKSTVSTYCGMSKLYIIHIHFYLFFLFTEKLRGTKTEQSDVATYGVIIRVFVFSG